MRTRSEKKLLCVYVCVCFLMSVGLPSVCLSVPAVQEQKVCTASVDRQTHHNSLIPSQLGPWPRTGSDATGRGKTSQCLSKGVVLVESGFRLKHWKPERLSAEYLSLSLFLSLSCNLDLSPPPALLCAYSLPSLCLCSPFSSSSGS